MYQAIETLFIEAHEEINRTVGTGFQFTMACNKFCFLFDYIATALPTEQFVRFCDKRSDIIHRIANRDKECAMEFVNICAKHNGFRGRIKC